MKKKIFVELLIIFFDFSFINAEENVNSIVDFYMATAKNDISKMELILKSHPEYAEIDLPELFKGSFVSWLIEEKQLKFNNTKERRDFISNFSRKPIIIASIYGNTEAVALLINYKVNLDVIDEIGYTALIRASMKGNNKIVELLLKNGADKNYETPDTYGFKANAMLIACCYGQKDTVELLLKNGFDINSTNSSGATPFIIGAVYQDNNFLDYLISKGANINTKVNVGNHDALYYACSLGNLENVKYLINKGFPLNNIYNTNLSILSSLEGKNNIEILKLLLDNHAGLLTGTGEPFLSLFRFLINGQTDFVYEIIKRQNYFDAINNLIDRSEFIDPKTQFHKTVLMYCVSNNYEDIVTELISKGVDVNRSSSNENLTALHFAIDTCNFKMIDILLDAGADVDIKSNNYGTPIQLFFNMFDKYDLTFGEYYNKYGNNSEMNEETYVKGNLLLYYFAKKMLPKTTDKEILDKYGHYLEK